VHVDHIGYGAVRGEHRLSVDGGNPIRNLDLSRVELYAPNRDDGLRAKLTVVTRGADGCTAYVGDETIDVPGHPVDGIVSTLGAGDVFHGALLACFARGLELRPALAKANAAAALSCRALDGRSAIPSWEELP
jgi:sugar/nucleoside kinase (ribokinase family)